MDKTGWRRYSRFEAVGGGSVMSTQHNHVTNSDDLLNRPDLAINGPFKHFCAVCFADAPLKRCASCKLIYYCSPLCQSSNWTEHSEICKNSGMRMEWCSAVTHAIDTFGASNEVSISERKSTLVSLNLLENWSKSILASIGFVKVLLLLIMREKYSSYNFSLVALVDLLRMPDGQSLNENLCFLFVFEELGLVPVLTVLAQHAQLHFSQKLSTLRFVRLLAAHPKLQPSICDQLDTLLPLISQTVEKSQSTDICSELGVILCSLLYSADSAPQHGLIQSKYGDSLNLPLWMSCAFGESPWSGDMEMSAVELLLALIIDIDLFPDYDDLFRAHIVTRKLLPQPTLLKQFVFGFLDMVLVPKEVFHGAALHALHILFSDSEVMDEVMKNVWLLSDLEEDEEATEQEKATGAESPLREMLRLLQTNPVVQLNFFQTHTHLNILHILRYVLLSPYCNTNFVEATLGRDHLLSYLSYLEERYLSAIGEAEKYKLAHHVSQVTKVGNQGEMEDVLQLITSVRGLVESLREDLNLEKYIEYMEQYPIGTTMAGQRGVRMDSRKRQRKKIVNTLMRVLLCADLVILGTNFEEETGCGRVNERRRLRVVRWLGEIHLTSAQSWVSPN